MAPVQLGNAEGWNPGGVAWLHVACVGPVGSPIPIIVWFMLKCEGNSLPLPQNCMHYHIIACVPKLDTPPLLTAVHLRAVVKPSWGPPHSLREWFLHKVLLLFFGKGKTPFFLNLFSIFQALCRPFPYTFLSKGEKSKQAQVAAANWSSTWNFFLGFSVLINLLWQKAHPFPTLW